jgi:hypothetical protein
MVISRGTFTGGVVEAGLPASELIGMQSQSYRARPISTFWNCAVPKNRRLNRKKNESSSAF